MMPFGSKFAPSQGITSLYMGTRKTSKFFFFETGRCRASIYDIKYLLGDLYQGFFYGLNRTRLVRVIFLWIRKFAKFDLVYTLTCTNAYQSAPNLVEIYVTLRSWMSWIIGLIGLKQSDLFALQLELVHSIWFTPWHVRVFMLQT